MIDLVGVKDNIKIINPSANLVPNIDGGKAYFGATFMTINEGELVESFDQEFDLEEEFYLNLQFRLYGGLSKVQVVPLSEYDDVDEELDSLLNLMIPLIRLEETNDGWTIKEMGIESDTHIYRNYPDTINRYGDSSDDEPIENGAFDRSNIKVTRRKSGGQEVSDFLFLAEEKLNVSWGSDPIETRVIMRHAGKRPAIRNTKEQKSTSNNDYRVTEKFEIVDEPDDIVTFKNPNHKDDDDANITMIIAEKAASNNAITEYEMESALYLKHENRALPFLRFPPDFGTTFSVNINTASKTDFFHNIWGENPSNFSNIVNMYEGEGEELGECIYPVNRFKAVYANYDPFYHGPNNLFAYFIRPSKLWLIQAGYDEDACIFPWEDDVDFGLYLGIDPSTVGYINDDGFEMWTQSDVIDEYDYYVLGEYYSDSDWMNDLIVTEA